MFIIHNNYYSDPVIKLVKIISYNYITIIIQTFVMEKQKGILQTLKIIKWYNNSNIFLQNTVKTTLLGQVSTSTKYI